MDFENFDPDEWLRNLNQRKPDQEPDIGDLCAEGSQECEEALLQALQLVEMVEVDPRNVAILLANYIGGNVKMLSAMVKGLSQIAVGALSLQKDVRFLALIVQDLRERVERLES